ncbi:MAG: M20/M25/M40 family metallo-hydrolase [Candidatus Azotimanducaceae bacterium]
MNQTILCVVFVMGWLLSQPAGGANAGSVEIDPISAIPKVVGEQRISSIELLEEVVNINSGTMNHAGVKRVADVFARELTAIGFTSTWHSMESVNRAGHLFAEYGQGGVCQLLIGHLDTVFEKNSPFQGFEREGDIAVGPGVNDMKGGDVVIVHALKALKEIGALDRGRYIVALIGDEEKSGSPKSVSRFHLIEAAKTCDVALGFEYAAGLNAATVARRGSSGWTLEVEGVRAHSSRIFSEQVGSGAIFEAARILSAFHDHLSDERYLTFNPGVIVGGTEIDYDAAQNAGQVFGKSNVVAQTVKVQGGLRTLSRAQELSARDRMQAITTQDNLPHTSARIRFNDGYPPMAPTAGNLTLLKMLNQASEDLGYGSVEAYDPGLRGAADVSFVAEHVDAIDGIGAEGRGAHALNEQIDLSTLPLLIERAALLMYRISRLDAWPKKRHSS